MSSQQLANEALAIWQAHRHLPPEERIEALMANFFAPPPETDLEYEITMRNVEREMSCPTQ